MVKINTRTVLPSSVSLIYDIYIYIYIYIYISESENSLTVSVRVYPIQYKVALS
jgi:hypothetical protein